jgi:hypothetical protein
MRSSVSLVIMSTWRGGRLGLSFLLTGALIAGCSSGPSTVIKGNKLPDGTLVGSMSSCLIDITTQGDEFPRLQNTCGSPVEVATCRRIGGLNSTTFCGELKTEKELRIEPKGRLRISDRSTEYLVACGVGSIRRQPWKDSEFSSGSASCADGGLGTPRIERSTAADSFAEGMKTFNSALKPVLEAEAARRNQAGGSGVPCTSTPGRTGPACSIGCEPTLQQSYSQCKAGSNSLLAESKCRTEAILNRDQPYRRCIRACEESRMPVNNCPAPTPSTGQR